MTKLLLALLLAVSGSAMALDSDACWKHGETARFIEVLKELDNSLPQTVDKLAAFHPERRGEIRNLAAWVYSQDLTRDRAQLMAYNSCMGRITYRGR